MNRDVVRGLLVGAIALGFGLGSLRYTIGGLSNAGPGLFPLLVSGLLLAVAVLMLIRTRYEAPVPLQVKLRSIASVLGSLLGFVLFTKLVGMLAGIVVLVFVAAFAGSSYSWKRNAQVAVALVAVAFVFQHLLGLNLGLY